MNRIYALALAAAIPLHSAHAQTLQQIEHQIDSITSKQPFDYSAYTAVTRKARTRITELIAKDSLQTAADFYLASRLAADPTGFYESRRVEHELALVALVLGHPESMKRVGMSWDGLNLSIGRGQRIGSFKRDNIVTDMDPIPAPSIVRNVFNDLTAARARAGRASTNAELERLRNDDQADREGEIDNAKMKRMAQNDPVRRARVVDLIATGALATGRDFHNASLIMQHGRGVDDFRLAHELSICAVALGDSTAVWLVSRTYDRLLLNLGHRQRLNTQFGGTGGELLPVDPTAVNDRIRRILGSKSLPEKS